MNYDVWGSFSPAVGPNAPLNDTCAPLEYQHGSAVSAVQAWTSAGLPRSQLVLGVPSYGHSFLVKESVALTEQGGITAYPLFEPEQPRGESSDDEPGVDVCGVQASWGGDFDSWGLVEGKFLDKRGKPLQGIYYRYDECSQTVRFGNGRCSPTVELTQNAQLISPTFTTPLHKLWFRSMTPGPLKQRENSSKTLVCGDMRCGKLLGTIKTSLSMPLGSEVGIESHPRERRETVCARTFVRVCIDYRQFDRESFRPRVRDAISMQYQCRSWVMSLAKIRQSVFDRRGKGAEYADAFLSF